MTPALDRIARPICLEMPRRLTPLSAWHEHIPFAMTLISTLAPRVVVELGTHAGDSYCAMCQAVEMERLATRCFAVDTWEGDDQAGRYGPEVLEDLRAHHDRLYTGFSTLVQSTFDEARGRFEPGAIDLLHIDGLHTYEAVRGDFEGWLPKMSPTGVVMLHDVAVREPGFGVWRLWEELKARYPYFEFFHGYGLGLVAVGADVPRGLAPLLDARNDEAAVVRRFFEELGARLSMRETLRREREAVEVLRAAVSDRDARLQALEARTAEAEARATEAAGRAAEAAARAAEVESRHATLEARWRATEQALRECSAGLAAIQSSRGYQALVSLRAFRDVLAPPGSARREVLGRALRKRGGATRGR